jgi:hypothetical protein
MLYLRGGNIVRSRFDWAFAALQVVFELKTAAIPRPRASLIVPAI